MSATSAAVLALTGHACRFAYGDPRTEDFAFCGRARVQGRPYCPDHELVSVGLKRAADVPRPDPGERATKAVTREQFRKAYRAAPPGEFRDRLLALLRTYPQGGEKPSSVELARRLETTSEQVRAIMQRLEKRGWIEMAPFRVVV